MPIIKSAKKKLRQDKTRTTANDAYRKKYKTAIKKASTGGKAKKLVSAAYSAIDKAVKKHVIHRNKAKHLKSKVAKSSKK